LNTLKKEDERLKRVTFFFEATHGNFIRDALRSVGVNIQTHKNMGWMNNMLDVDIIAECGKKGWALLSGDKSIERVPEERQAVINAKCKVFMFDDSHETSMPDWAASLLVARHRILEIADRADGPLFVTIRRCKVQGHITQPRFVEAAGGGWRPEQVIEIQQVVTVSGGPHIRPPRKQQLEIQYPPPPSDSIDKSEEIICEIEVRKAISNTLPAFP
jgi:hypothetical protein